jgi:hypothetical protein
MHGPGARVDRAPPGQLGEARDCGCRRVGHRGGLCTLQKPVRGRRAEARTASRRGAEGGRDLRRRRAVLRPVRRGRARGRVRPCPCCFRLLFGARTASARGRGRSPAAQPFGLQASRVPRASERLPPALHATAPPARQRGTSPECRPPPCLFRPADWLGLPEPALGLWVKPVPEHWVPEPGRPFLQPERLQERAVRMDKDESEGTCPPLFS